MHLTVDLHIGFHQDAIASAGTARVRFIAKRMVDAGTPPDLRAIAAELKVAPEFLQRELRKEGQPWRYLWDDLRREIVEHALKEGLKVSELAWNLGYSEPAALHHAIQRWFGTCPRAIRTGETSPE